ncbi:BTB/POZ domain-containing protein 7-like [Oppia nitens]|uniref:BTB/POZ domain-containing protein 7-like n=1 Tax=Oppia nitens TaxID=1686743 RepID=UPI0023D9E4B0|nr:BTB/POZ domain-containing protein 7-like [Oppia nitens]
MGANHSSQMSSGSSTVTVPSLNSTSQETVNSWTSYSDNNSGTGSHSTLTDGSMNSVMPIKEKKRKNLSSLATLRKRLVRKRRTSRSFDHSQALRDFISSWSTRDIKQLCEEYECTGLLKELSLLAESARPLASTAQNDFCELFDFKYCSDITLVYKGVQFPVHKAIVCVRCPAFRELLGKKPPGSYVTVNLDITGLRVELFHDLLRYLYSGELSGSYDPRNNYDVLLRISEQCGVPNPLAYDLKHLLETGLYSDASLLFSPQQHHRDCSQQPVKKCRACSDQNEYSCHRAILAARSPFFRSVIQRQERRKAETSDPNTVLHANQRTKILLDESIIPRRYARVLLHVMYRDAAELHHLLQSCVCKCVNEVNIIGTNTASATNNNSNTVSTLVLVKEVMDLYEIARFLELDFLVQSCEDLLIDSLSLDSLLMILKWSEQPHGSPWVKRQALCFMREEFSSIVSSALLCQLELSHLIEALKSDFLNASELEVLQAVIKWGENRLMKRMEEREPNVVSNTAHSLRRGIRKKELNDTELRDIISELICHVRVVHILPLDSDILTNAAKRGLISTLPPYMVGEDSVLPQSRGIAAWFRGRGTGPFIRPRYFTPYVEEAKALLDDRIGRQGEIVSNRVSRQISHIPDALYMLDKTNNTVSPMNDVFLGSDHYHLCISSSSSSSAVCYEDIHEAGSRPQMPILEDRVVVLMKQREQELKGLPLSQRALALVSNRCEALRLIQLRVCREFGLPDAASDVLHGNNYSMPVLEGPDDGISRLSYVAPSEVGSLSIPPPPRPLTSNLSGITTTVLNEDRDLYSTFSELKLESSVPRLAHFDLESQFSSNESRHTLSDLIPDIAIATTTAIEEFQLAQRSADSMDLKRDIESERPRFV